MSEYGAIYIFTCVHIYFPFIYTMVLSDTCQLCTGNQQDEGVFSTAALDTSKSAVFSYTFHHWVTNGFII